jgi:hypothetical protein
MNANAVALSQALKDWQHEKRIRRGTAARSTLIEPMDEHTRNEVLAELAGDAPPVIVPVLKKRRGRG